jgi:hypothetical protein
MQNLNKALGGLGAVGAGLGVRAENVIPHLAFNQLIHQTIDRAPASGDLLKDGSAIILRFYGSFQPFNLAPDPADPPQ